MVFRGKPSSGCAHCRTRKIRCSQSKPECSQCIRQGWECPGYRNKVDLLFCDQSKEIQSKVRIREDRKMKKHQLDLNANIRDVALSVQNVPDLDLPIEEYALAFFFRNYVLNTSETRSYNGYLPALYSNVPLESPLGVTVLSVGLAGLSRINLSRPLRIVARLKYCAALSLTNNALHETGKAIRDDTLASILLLGLYEIITCDCRQSIQSWEAHMSGCIAVMELRGSKQFLSEISMELFQQLRTQIIFGCLQRGHEVPKSVEKFTLMAQETRGEDVVGSNRLAGILSDLCHVRAVVQRGAEIRTEEVIERCQRIDDQLVEWVAHLPPSTAYTSVCVSENCEVSWGTSYDVYLDFSSAYLWNAYRGARLMANDLLIDYLRLKSDALHENAARNYYQRSVFIVKDMSRQIFDSIPFQLGFHSDEPKETQAFGGLFAIWYLYLVGSMDIAAGTMREWSTIRLEDIGRKFGIQQAFAIAGVLRKRAKPGLQMPEFDSAKQLHTDKERRWNLEVVESLLPEAGVIRLSQKKLRYINEMPPEPDIAG